MGSYISVYNDTPMPVEIWFTLRGGGRPAGGDHKGTYNFEQENKAWFQTVSLALTVHVSYKEPGQPSVTKTRNVFTPAGAEDVLQLRVSNIIGQHPKLHVKEESIQIGWVDTVTLANESSVADPQMKYKLHYGMTDKQGNKEKTSFAVTAVSEVGFMGLFNASLSTTFGTENEDWIEGSITQYKDFEITIPGIEPKTKLIIQQQQVVFDIDGDYKDTFRVRGQNFKIKTESLE